jgi:chorismate-pyruvate lyase
MPLLSSLIEGTPLREVAIVLADLIRITPRPLTALLEDLTGLAVTVDADDPIQRPVDEARHEDGRLTPGGLNRVSCRRSRLAAGGAVIARTELAWLEQRLPWDACRELKEGAEPAGKILARWGVHREDRRALAVWPAEGETAIRSSAVLMIGDESVAIAYEELTAEACALLAR